MRNFKKVMALAVSAAALATSVSAFAELEYKVEGLTGAYEKETNSLSLTVDGAAGDKTVLVLGNGVAAADATGDDILYINQYTADETAYQAMGLKGVDALPAGEYAIKIGYTDANGDFAIADGKIVVAEKVVDEPQYITVMWGDIDSDEEITVLDASAVVSALLGSPEETAYVVGEVVSGTNVTWGDIDSDEEITVLDASAIVSALLGSPEETAYVVGETVKIPVNAQ